MSVMKVKEAMHCHLDINDFENNVKFFEIESLGKYNYL